MASGVQLFFLGCFPIPQWKLSWSGQIPWCLCGKTKSQLVPHFPSFCQRCLEWLRNSGGCPNVSHTVGHVSEKPTPRNLRRETVDFERFHELRWCTMSFTPLPKRPVSGVNQCWALSQTYENHQCVFQAKRSTPDQTVRAKHMGLSKTCIVAANLMVYHLVHACSLL